VNQGQRKTGVWEFVGYGWQINHNEATRNGRVETTGSFGNIVATAKGRARPRLPLTRYKGVPNIKRKGGRRKTISRANQADLKGVLQKTRLPAPGKPSEENLATRNLIATVRGRLGGLFSTRFLVCCDGSRSFFCGWHRRCVCDDKRQNC